MLRKVRLYNYVFAVALAGAAAAVPASALADSVQVSERTGMVVSLPQNKGRMIRSSRAFSKALVGNPEIADVVPLDQGTVYVLGKKQGTTTLTLYDRRNGAVATMDLVVGPDLDALRGQFSSLMPGEGIRVRLANNGIILEGTASSAAAAERAMRLAESFAPGKVMNFMSLASPQQVLLEARFSEVRRDTVKQLGIRTLSFSNSGNFEGITGSVTPENTFGSFAGSFGIGAVNINLALDALEERGLSTTLAQPNLVTLSGETASLLAGGEFPIPVTSNPNANTGITSVQIEFKEFGVRLAFTPTVLANGVINLVVKAEVSELDPNASIRLNSIVIPGLAVRRAQTTLELRDTESFAMAGLIKRDFMNTVREVPVLARIPIIGALFRSSSFDRAETELVITVTPRIVKPLPATTPIPLPTDRLAPASEARQFLFGETESKKK